MLIPALLALAAALALTPLAIRVSRRVGFLDHPEGGVWKNHSRSTPYGGGIVVFLVFAAAVLLRPVPLDLPTLALLAGSLVALGIGTLDDARARSGRVSGQVKLVALCLAALIPLSAGIGIDFVTGMDGGTLGLRLLEIPLLGGGTLSLPADLLTILWIAGLATAMDLLDGVDGLTSGITVISSVTIGILSLHLGQVEVAGLAFLLAAAAGGYLPWNLSGKVFTGDGGVFFYGFALATLAILSGTKVATVALVAALPILDGVFVILRRMLAGRSPFSGGRDHLHHILTDLIGPRAAVLAIWLVSAGLGAAALLLQTTGKLAVFSAIGVVLLAVVLGLARLRDGR